MLSIFCKNQVMYPKTAGRLYILNSIKKTKQMSIFHFHPDVLKDYFTSVFYGRSMSIHNIHSYTKKMIPKL